MNEISQVRSNNWIQMIHARQESGLTVKDWCSQNNVSLHAYYYWLRKLRKQSLQEAGITSKSIEPSESPQLVKVPEPLVASQSGFADDHFALRIRHDPFQKDVLFLFCGSRQDRFKGLGAVDVV